MRQFLFLAMMLSGASAATLFAEQGTLMRRSVDKEVDRGLASTVQLSGAGEVIRLAPKQKATLDDDNTCDIDYIEGKDSLDECDVDHHLHIYKPQTCIEAALEMGIPTMPDSDGEHGDAADGDKEEDAADLIYFKTPRSAYTHHPGGCYKGPCNKTGGECIFYNSVQGRAGDPVGTGMPPKPGANGVAIVGRPICSRRRLMNGTANADGGATSCGDPDYMVVTDETYCETAAGCIGDTTTCAGPGDENFRIGLKNRSLHDYYPQGCFIRHADNCVYMNPDHPETGMPSRPQVGGGTPVCTIRLPADGGTLAGGVVTDETATDTNTTR